MPKKRMQNHGVGRGILISRNDLMYLFVLHVLAFEAGGKFPIIPKDHVEKNVLSKLSR